MGSAETQPAGREARAVILESGEVTLLLMDLTVLGCKDSAPGLFAHVTMRSAADRQPLGYVRATLVGLDVTSPLAQWAALEIATRVWRLQEKTRRSQPIFSRRAMRRR